VHWPRCLTPTSIYQNNIRRLRELGTRGAGLVDGRVPKLNSARDSRAMAGAEGKVLRME